MFGSYLRMVPVLCLALLGCFPRPENTALVPSNPFGSPPPTQITHASTPPASVQAAARVDSLGRKLLMANPQIGVQPLFLTIGAPQLEVFHVGTSEVAITEGLVKQCASDGQLAAVLALELGKMVSEKEFLTGPQGRAPEPEPPMEVRVGSDNGGFFGPADQLHRAELAKFDKERRRRAAGASTAVDPQPLARGYLLKAGYTAADLDAATPLLHSAAENNSFEKQLQKPPQGQH
jgi:hypothetical protein